MVPKPLHADKQHHGDTKRQQVVEHPVKQQGTKDLRSRKLGRQ